VAISASGDNDDVVSEINVTPLVDVMLVLLVVFIVTAPLLSNAVTVNLPTVGRVQLLLDGREADTLAGHVDLRQPLRKNEGLIRTP